MKLPEEDTILLDSDSWPVFEWIHRERLHNLLGTAESTIDRTLWLWAPSTPEGELWVRQVAQLFKANCKVRRFKAKDLTQSSVVAVLDSIEEYDPQEPVEDVQKADLAVQHQSYSLFLNKIVTHSMWDTLGKVNIHMDYNMGPALAWLAHRSVWRSAESDPEGWRVFVTFKDKSDNPVRKSIAVPTKEEALALVDKICDSDPELETVPLDPGLIGILGCDWLSSISTSELYETTFRLWYRGFITDPFDTSKPITALRTEIKLESLNLSILELEVYKLVKSGGYPQLVIRHPSTQTVLLSVTDPYINSWSVEGVESEPKLSVMDSPSFPTEAALVRYLYGKDMPIHVIPHLTRWLEKFGLIVRIGGGLVTTLLGECAWAWCTQSAPDLLMWEYVHNLYSLDSIHDAKKLVTESIVEDPQDRFVMAADPDSLGHAYVHSKNGPVYKEGGSMYPLRIDTNGFANKAEDQIVVARYCPSCDGIEMTLVSTKKGRQLICNSCKAARPA